MCEFHNLINLLNSKTNFYIEECEDHIYYNWNLPNIIISILGKCCDGVVSHESYGIYVKNTKPELESEDFDGFVLVPLKNVFKILNGDVDICAVPDECLEVQAALNESFDTKIEYVRVGVWCIRGEIYDAYYDVFEERWMGCIENTKHAIDLLKKLE